MFQAQKHVYESKKYHHLRNRYFQCCRFNVRFNSVARGAARSSSTSASAIAAPDTAGTAINGAGAADDCTVSWGATGHTTFRVL